MAISPSEFLHHYFLLLHLKFISQGLLKGPLSDVVGQPNVDSPHPRVGDTFHGRVKVLLLQPLSPHGLDKVPQIFCSAVGKCLQVR